MKGKRKTFAIAQLIDDCVTTFGWEEDVASYAVMTNEKLIEGLLNQHEALISAEAGIERVFTILLKQGEIPK